MMELKFCKETEIPRSQGSLQERMFGGYYKFSTQSTVVYDTYCLLDLGSKLMRLNVVCDRIFHRDGRIAVLSGSRLDVYTDLAMEKTVDVSGHENICDFLPSLMECIESISNDRWIFCVSDNLLEVSSTTVQFNGKAHANEIHEDGCRYFVAWKGDVAILGNNKSLSFMYFYCREKVEAEEYSPLCLRTDIDTFDPIPVDDIKFSGGRLLMMDVDIVTSYTIHGVELPEGVPDKKVVDYFIKDGHIVEGNDAHGSSYSNKDDLIVSGGLFENKVLSSGMGVFEKNGMHEKPCAGSVGVSRAQKSTGLNALQSLSESSMLGESANAFPSLDSLEKACQSSAGYLSSVSTLSKTSSKNDCSVSLGPEQKNLEKLSDLEQLEKSIARRIEKLKSSLQSIVKRPNPTEAFKFVESKYDLGELYSCIFNNQIEEYEQSLSSMIVRLNNLKSIDIANVRESIRYFDSKIFENRSCRRPVVYSDPLCPRLGQVMRLSNPVADLIEGLKIIEIQEPPKHVKFECSGPKSDSMPNSSMQAKTEGGDKVKDLRDGQLQSVPPQHQEGNSNIGQSGPCPSFLSHASFPSQSVSQNTQGDSITLFGSSTDPGISFKVSDTTSLFNSLISNPDALRADGIKGTLPELSTATDAQNVSQGTNQPVSAFNRLAGTRRLFQ